MQPVDNDFRHSLTFRNDEHDAKVAQRLLLLDNYVARIALTKHDLLHNGLFP